MARADVERDRPHAQEQRQGREEVEQAARHPRNEAARAVYRAPGSDRGRAKKGSEGQKVFLAPEEE